MQGIDTTLSQTLDGKAGAHILDRLINDGVIAPGERAGLAKGNALTAAGTDRISELVLGRFLNDPKGRAFHLQGSEPAGRLTDPFLR